MQFFHISYDSNSSRNQPCISNSEKERNIEEKHKQQKEEFEEILNNTWGVFEKYLKEAKPGYHEKVDTKLPYSLLLSEKRSYVLLKHKSRQSRYRRFSGVGQGKDCKVTLCYGIEEKQYYISRSQKTRGLNTSRPTKDEIDINNKLKEEPNYFATGEVFQYFSHSHHLSVHKTTFIMEYYENESLEQAMKSGKIKQLSSEKRIDIAKRIAKALDLLHVKFGYQHNDVKLENVLLNKDFEPRLTDFGFSCALNKNSGVFGTPIYIPPEHKNSDKGDIWAFGVLLLNLKHGGIGAWSGTARKLQDFYFEISTPLLLEEKLQPLLMKKNRKNPKHLDSCIYKCLTYSPQARPTAEKVVKLLEKVEID